MAGRVAAGALLACCLLLPKSLFAQGAPQPSPWVDAAGNPVPISSPPRYPPALQYGTVQQHQPFPYSPAAAATPGVPYQAHDGIVTTSMTADEEWEPGPLEKALEQLTRNMWIRTEYLLWEIDEPGDTLLGAPLAGIVNPRAPFEITDPVFGQPVGTARVPSLSDITFRDKNGVRGTVGVPLTFADWETSIWTLEKARDSHVARDIPSDPNADLPHFIATSTLVDGRVSDNVELYDDSFTATYTSKIWGAETKLVFNTDPSIEGIRLQPMVGFGHLNIQEELQQRGVFDSFDTLAPLTSEIDSDTKNHLYGPILGLRAEFIAPWQWITLGLEPKVMLGVDNYTAQVRTNNFRGPGDPEVITQEEKTIFSPVIEAAVYARFELTKRFTFHVGYNVLWAARITRPQDNILYNDNGPLPEPPGIVVRVGRQHLTLEGLTIGGVIYLH